jgi:hypothetical protein
MYARASRSKKFNIKMAALSDGNSHVELWRALNPSITNGRRTPTADWLHPKRDIITSVRCIPLEHLTIKAKKRKKK